MNTPIKNLRQAINAIYYQNLAEIEQRYCRTGAKDSKEFGRQCIRQMRAALENPDMPGGV